MKIKSNITPSFLAYIGALLIVIATGYFLHVDTYLFAKHKTADPAAIVAEMEKNTDKTVFESIRDSLSDIIKQYGIEGALAVDAYAFTNNKMGIYQCHALTHLIGHESIVYYGKDYAAVASNYSHFCELGYVHGAEAQVVLSGGDYQHELYKLCDQIKKKDPSATCFHGAGHAFMNQTLDVQTSLTLCDGLIDEQHTIDDVTPCYNAVFAELTNLVGGRDGETAIPYTNGPPLTIKEATPLEYCAKIGERYRIQCVFEFSGLGIGPASTPADVEGKLRNCVGENFDEELESACIKSVAAVGMQHLLAGTSTVSVPSFILSLSDPLRNAYILGAATEMKQYVVSGATRNWESFCGGFTKEADASYCKSIFAQQG